nr:MAG TPA: hypothetical protein [Caudoviricetes sp.]
MNFIIIFNLLYILFLLFLTLLSTNAIFYF